MRYLSDLKDRVGGERVRASGRQVLAATTRCIKSNILALNIRFPVMCGPCVSLALSSFSYTQREMLGSFLTVASGGGVVRGPRNSRDGGKAVEFSTDPTAP